MLSKTLKKYPILLFLFSFNVFAEPDCHALLKAGKPELAITSAQQALKANAKQVDFWQCLGRAHGFLGQYQEGLNALSQGKQLAKNRQELLVTHVLMGNLQFSQQAYADALEQYKISLGIAQAENNRPFSRISNTLIGDTLLAQQNPSEALQHYQSASELAMNDNERAEAYAKIALAHNRLNELDKAIEFQRKSAVMQQKVGTLDDYAEANLLLGQYFAQNKEYAHAEKTYQKLLQFSKDNGGDYYAAKTQVYLAQAKFAQADKAAAQAYLKQAKALASKLNAPELNKLIDDTEKNTR